MAASRDQLAFKTGRDRFSTLLALDAVRDAVIVADATDAQLRILFANAAARKLFDYLGSQLVGASLCDLLDSATANTVRSAISQLSGTESRSLRNIHWQVAGLDLTSATELRLLDTSPANRSLMLTLPSIASDFIRIGDCAETQQFSQFLADTQNAPSIGCWEHRVQSGEVIWTAGMYRVFDITPEEFSPTQGAICSLFPADVKASALKMAPSSGKTIRSVDIETETTTCKDRKIWVHVVAQFECRDGCVIRSYGAVQDITAQKVAQLTYARVTDWLKLSMDTAQIYAWRWGRDRNEFEFVGPEHSKDSHALDMATMEDFLGRVHPDDRARMSTSLQLALDERVELNEEFRLRRADGTYRWQATVGRPLVGDNQRVTGLVGATKDVTRRRVSQARVNENSLLLRAATANTTDLMLLLDANLNIRFCNRSFGGFDPQQLTGMNLHRLVGGADWQVQSQLLISVLTRGIPVTFGHEAPGDDGETHRYECRAIPVYDKGVIGGLSVTLSDITERKRLEREILEISTREQERIGQDLHDGLGQELTGVALMLRGLAMKIRRDYPSAADDVDEIVGLVNHSIEAARSLARGLSPIGDSRGGLVHALRALAVRGRDLYGLAVRFRSKVWPQLTLDDTCSGHLYRIAQEALTNVARHAKATHVDIRLQVTGNKFVVSISDDGVGLDRSFKAYSGMGLKLMSYRAGMIGATLEVLPNEPTGTRIRISGDQPTVL